MSAVYETTLRLNCRFRKLDPCVSTEKPTSARSAKSARCARKARKLRLRDRYQRANSRECPGYFCAPDVTSRDCTGWLGREDSNLRMAESKSAALPLGYAPSGGLLRRGGARTIATAIRPING